MIIDFHTHIFPDKIAQKTIDMLAAKGKIEPFSDGSVTGLLGEMEKADVDIAVTLPVLTSPAQFDGVNRFAKNINEIFKDRERQLISFAGIHPLCEDIEGKVKWIKDNGFKGIKLHPDYQETFIDDERYIKILQCAKDQDLIVITHSGVDIAYRGLPVRCTPERAKKVIDKVKHGKFVLAHYGASEMSEEVYELLCGEDVYFDTAFVLKYTSKETFEKILRKHGADRILFATDSPWSKIKDDVEIIKSYGLGRDVENKIFFENARKLLEI